MGKYARCAAIRQGADILTERSVDQNGQENGGGQRHIFQAYSRPRALCMDLLSRTRGMLPSSITKGTGRMTCPFGL